MTEYDVDKLLAPKKPRDFELAARAAKNPKILTIDIERFPAELVGWGLFNQNFGLNQVRSQGGMFSFAAKWAGKPKVEFYSTFHHGREEMLNQAHRLLSEAEIVVGWNSKGFDAKHIETEFYLDGMLPPAPYRHVDLMLTAKSRFRFLSNKLDNVAQLSGVGAKVSHSGMPLWLACMEGDEKAWSKMRTYNKQDVVITEKLLWKFLPWIKNFPVLGILEVADHMTCRNCGSDDVSEHQPGWTTGVLIYPKLQCNKCGAWFRGNKNIGRASATYGI